MLSYERAGSGDPLLLVHGTNSSREVWRPLLPELARHREVFAVDLPGHGRTPAGSATPPEWARELGAWLDQTGLDTVSVVGHSSGGWTALELAKLGRARGVLALAPAGLWARRSPLATDATLVISWRLSRLLPERVVVAGLRSSLVRRLGLRSISARPSRVAPELAATTASAAIRAANFPRHFAQTRRLRFEGGGAIDASVPVIVVWGDDDRIAPVMKSQRTDQLPPHAVVQTWSPCGHMLMWDAPERVVAAALALP